MKIQFDQLAAFLVIVGGMLMRVFGIDGEVWALVLIAGGFLFGTGYQARKKPTLLPPALNTTEQAKSKDFPV